MAQLFAMRPGGCTQGVQNINPSHVLSGASQLMSFPCLNVECSLLARVAQINWVVLVHGQVIPLDLSLDTPTTASGLHTVSTSGGVHGRKCC